MKFGEFDPELTVRGDGGTGVFTFENSESGTFSYQPSAWIANAYGVTAISTPVKKLLGVAHPNPEIVELHIGGSSLTAIDRTADLPVCFNGAGELLPCASNVQPSAVDPYSGSWSGRMLYDRKSPAGNACWDADVEMVVVLSNNGAHYLNGSTVRPDVGGLYINSMSGFVSKTGNVTDHIYDVNGQRIDITIAFNTHGQAQGVWAYVNSDCYGEWTFTKD